MKPESSSFRRMGHMKRTRFLLASMIFMLALPSLFGQDVEIKDKKTKKEVAVISEAPLPDVPVKVQILLTEFEGTRKVSSLPYTIYTIATISESYAHAAHLRLGLKVSVPVDSNTFQNYDVGTNIDCHVEPRSDAQYGLDFTIERTSLSTHGVNGEESEWKPGEASSTSRPLIRSFKDMFMLIMRDGHTMEGTSAVDPVTGHVLKVEVTLNVLKPGDTSHIVSPLGN
jgi:hypothetical protein